MLLQLRIAVYGVIGGVLAGALLGPFAFILFFVSGIISSSEQRKKCPFCAEWIRHEAIVCSHCQRNLPRIKS